MTQLIEDSIPETAKTALLRSLLLLFFSVRSHLKGHLPQLSYPWHEMLCMVTNKRYPPLYLSQKLFVFKNEDVDWSVVDDEDDGVGRVGQMDPASETSTEDRSQARYEPKVNPN